MNRSPGAAPLTHMIFRPRKLNISGLFHIVVIFRIWLARNATPLRVDHPDMPAFVVSFRPSNIHVVFRDGAESNCHHNETTTSHRPFVRIQHMNISPDHLSVEDEQTETPADIAFHIVKRSAVIDWFHSSIVTFVQWATHLIHYNSVKVISTDNGEQ